MTIKAIIFDLGGVILDINFERMATTFEEELAVESFRDYFTPLAQIDLFEQLELGTIDPLEFYREFRKLSGHTDLSDSQIRAAWNQILTDFDPERMAWLEKLAERYPLYLFSNTNEIHVVEFEQRCLEQTGQPLSHYFKGIYYSNDLHVRKPNPGAFQRVLDLAGLTATETIFVDDNADNIMGAQQLGLQTVHLVAPQTILDLNFDGD